MTTLPLSLFENGNDRFASVFRSIPEVESFFSRPAGSMARRSSLSRSFDLDIEERADSYVVSVDLPGIKQDAVDVTLEGEKLTLVVKSSDEEKKVEGRNYICKERWSGSARRTIVLPAAATAEDVDATLKDGVLTLTIKKPQQEVVKKIKIK